MKSVSSPIVTIEKFNCEKSYILDAFVSVYRSEWSCIPWLAIKKSFVDFINGDIVWNKNSPAFKPVIVMNVVLNIRENEHH